MICNFTKDITTDSIEMTASNFADENDIRELNKKIALQRIISDAFDLDTWEEADSIIDAISEDDKIKLLVAFEDAYAKCLKEIAHQWLWS